MSRERQAVAEFDSVVESADSPGVALVATPDNGDAIAREVLRAKKHGHDVFVTHLGTPNAESVQFAEQLDAEVVPPQEDDPTLESVENELAAVAHTLSLPGLVVVPPSCPRIDYGLTSQFLDDCEEFTYRADEQLVQPTAEKEESTVDGVLVGIPAYNESDTVGDVVDKARKYASEVVVVDDGSDDDTAAAAREAGAAVVEHEENRGYGGALQTVFQTASERDADHLVVVDADGQHDTSDIPRLVNRQRETGAGVVIGSRFVGDGSDNIPMYRRFGLRTINFLMNVSHGAVRSDAGIRDTQSGFRAYDREFVECITDNGTMEDNMGASLDILRHALDNGYDVQEVNVDISYDVDNANSQNPISHGYSLVTKILATIERRHPILFFGVPGFFSCLTGFGLAYWALQNYLRTKLFPVGIALSATVFLLVGLFFCFTAIILHSVTAHIDSLQG